MMRKIVLSEEYLKKLLNYALTHCESVCPSKRDPSTCLLLVELRRALNMPDPPCVEDYGGFDEKTFRKIVKDIEKRWGKSIKEVLIELKQKGPKNLQEQIDQIDGEFALNIIKVFKENRGVKMFIISESDDL